MIELRISPRVSLVKSGSKMTVGIAIRSTEKETVTVTFRFPAAAARLSPPSTTVELTRTDAAALAEGAGSHDFTVQAPPGLYVLKVFAVDGVTDASDEFLLEVEK